MDGARPAGTAWDAERSLLTDAAGYRAHVPRIEPEAELL